MQTDPRFALPEPETNPCRLCGRAAPGKLCEECFEYARIFDGFLELLLQDPPPPLEFVRIA